MDAVIGSAIFVLDGLLEAAKPGGPQLGEEGLQRFEALGTDHVEPSLTVGADGDEPGLPEDLEVVGDGLLGDLEVGGNLVDRAGLVADEDEHRPPAGLCECGPGRLGVHLPENIILDLYKL
jgi:hypothetical protein